MFIELCKVNIVLGKCRLHSMFSSKQNRYDCNRGKLSKESKCCRAGFSSAAECLLNTYESLASIPRTAKLTVHRTGSKTQHICE